MKQIILALIFAAEVFAFWNRGGGPLASHIVLTAATFAIISIFFAKSFRIRFTAPALFFALFFLMFLISFGFAAVPGYGFSELLLFANTGLLFLILPSLEITPNQKKWFGIFMSALAVIATLIGFFMYTRHAFPRLAGTFMNPRDPATAAVNAFANTLLLILPFSLALYFQKHERKSTTILTALACGVILTGFLLTFSRAAWIGLAAAGIFGLIFVIKQYCTRATAPGFIIRRIFALLIITVLFTNSLQTLRKREFATTSVVKKLLFQADEGAASASYRREYWISAVQLIKERPIFGAGVLGFRFLSPPLQKTFGIQPDHPHNAFLKVAVENGLPAALFLFAFFVFVFIKVWKRPWQDPLFLGALAAFFHNLLDFNFIASNFALFMVWLAFVFPNLPATAIRGEKILRKIFFLGFTLIFLLALYEGFWNIDFKLGRKAYAEGRYEEAAERLNRANSRLIFPRDSKNFLAETYLALFEKTNDSKWLNAADEVLLSPAPSDRPLETSDSERFSLLAEICLKKEQPKCAEHFAERSIAFNPTNNLKPYAQYIEALEFQKKPLAPKPRQRIEKLLDEYTQALKENRLYTVTSENPKYASKLLELLGEKQKQKEFDAIWFQELLKYTINYGPPRAAR